MLLAPLALPRTFPWFVALSPLALAKAHRNEAGDDWSGNVDSSVTARNRLEAGSLSRIPSVFCCVVKNAWYEVQALVQGLQEDINRAVRE